MFFLIVVIIGLFLLLFLYSTCVVSSKCSRLEERRDVVERDCENFKE